MSRTSATVVDSRIYLLAGTCTIEPSLALCGRFVTSGINHQYVIAGKGIATAAQPAEGRKRAAQAGAGARRQGDICSAANLGGTCAVPPRFAALRSLTQLDSLQICGIDLLLEEEQLSAALQPLTRLAQLALRFIYERQATLEYDSDSDESDMYCPFPWEAAVCGLTRLQELHICSDTDSIYDMNRGFAGALPAALSQLASLRHLEVLGMDEREDRDDDDQLQLAALPAVETAAIRLHTLSNEYPGLGRQHQVVLSRIVSLRLALRADYGDGEATFLPVIDAPALTELLLENIWLAPGSEQLSWLPSLPKLQRLALKQLHTAADQLPQGIMACSGLTELVLEQILLSYTDHWQRHNGEPLRWLRSLPTAGLYLSRLVRLSLSGNAFSVVPPSLASAMGLQHLALAWQRSQEHPHDQRAFDLQGLDVLDNCTSLRSLNLAGLKKDAIGLCRFQAARPDVRIILWGF